MKINDAFRDRPSVLRGGADVFDQSAAANVLADEWFDSLPSHTNFRRYVGERLDFPRATNIPGLGEQVNALFWTGTEYWALTQGGSIIKGVGTSSRTIASLSSSPLLDAASNGAGTIVVTQNTALGFHVSTDNGNTWTFVARTFIGYALRSIVWTGTLFVGGGGNPGISGNVSLATSPDGVTWTNRTSGLTWAITSVCYSGGLIVAVGGTGGVTTSTDGVTWTTQTSGTTASLASVASSGSLFVAVGANGRVITSPDGVTWTTQTSGTTSALTSVVWDGVKFYAVSNSVSITSTDGVTWTLGSTPPSNFTKVYVNNGVLAATNSTLRVSFSNDGGVSWDPEFGVECAINPISIAYSGGKYVVAGALGAVSSSPDFVNWNVYQAPSGVYVRRVVNFNNLWVVGATTGNIYTSTDGVVWVNRKPASGFSSDVTGIAWSGLRYVAVGSFGGVATSDDGLVWTGRSSGTTADFLGVASNGTVFVAVGASGTVRTSVDGVTWVSRTSGTALTLPSVVWTGQFFVAKTDSGLVLRSVDGVNWASVGQVASTYDLVIANGLLYTTSGNSINSVYVSPDHGTTWYRYSNASNTTVSYTSLNGFSSANGSVFLHFSESARQRPEVITGFSYPLWSDAPLKRWNGSAWVDALLKRWNGTAWVDAY